MICYLGLGANLGQPACQMAEAISALAAAPGVLLQRVSSVYRTAPVGLAEQPDFLNMVIAVRTELAPEALLAVTLAVEAQLGRLRTVKDGPRSMDVDILLCGDIVCDRPELTIPHPRLHQRQFVMVPLQEIAPQLVLRDGTAVSDLADPAAAGLRKLGSLALLVRQSWCAVEVCGDVR